MTSTTQTKEKDVCVSTCVSFEEIKKKDTHAKKENKRKGNHEKQNTKRVKVLKYTLPRKATLLE